MVAVLSRGLGGFLLSACSDEMDLQQSYPFKVENMPVPKRIIKKARRWKYGVNSNVKDIFSDARYTVRYFQPDGKGYAPAWTTDGVAAQ